MSAGEWHEVEIWLDGDSEWAAWRRASQGDVRRYSTVEKTASDAIRFGWLPGQFRIVGVRADGSREVVG